ncbi:MAG: DUF523 domain-containing protein [Desulfuromonadaceae bacterium]|nr:DUF523 domain-containing protein [Desulfuromonadaceae bacterium]
MPTTILVSACLLGIHCRYDGTAKADVRVKDYLFRKGLIPIPVCPEQLGGLPTPRLPCRFTVGSGREVLAGAGEVVTRDGRTVTQSFLNGARETLEIAGQCGCRLALLKERSPSCGVRQCYRGEVLSTGMGVAAALLSEHGIRVFSEEELAELDRFLDKTGT